MALAIFDLDNTLLAGDSDYLWGAFLVERGIVDGDEFARANERFYREYQEGDLDIHEFLRFSFRPLRDNRPEDLKRWRRDFLREKIEPIILPPACELVERHRAAGDTLLIVTATNQFVTAPIAERLGIPSLIATIPEQVNGHYTGEVTGIPAYQAGKVERLLDWLEETATELAGSTFYSDSHNDIPLLERVDRPVATDPDDRLRRYAHDRGWPIISLRGRSTP
ncbi:histidinol-phosphatase [Candidatus Thiosymbion oneisti]|uniref:histidinol-phosphatase n=1 Tax=Candidatus Thiosymbion oneisti TaxID=589554 RepID=UPI000AF8D72D|nr:HAD family phosphatase [Candidatus Thiosymbion oneisti]